MLVFTSEVFCQTDGARADGPGRTHVRDAADIMNGSARVQREVCGAAPHEDAVRQQRLASSRLVHTPHGEDISLANRPDIARVQDDKGNAVLFVDLATVPTSPPVSPGSRRSRAMTTIFSVLKLRAMNSDR